jgi:hypothetical protein
MRSGDLIREVFYPMMVASLIGTVWCVAKYTPASVGGSENMQIRFYAPLDPALSRRALMAGDVPPANPTTDPTRISSIDAGDR